MREIERSEKSTIEKFNAIKVRIFGTFNVLLMLYIIYLFLDGI